MTGLPGLNDNNIDFPFELDFSSSDAFYAGLRSQIEASLRQKNLLRSGRAGDGRLLEIVSLHAHGVTLDGIGRKFGVTRERVRQIERKFWTQVSFFKSRFEQLETMVTGVLRRKGWFDRVDNVVYKFVRHLNWTEREVRYLLIHFFHDLSDKFVFVGKNSEYVSLADHNCWKCPEFKALVKETVKEVEERNESLPLENFAKLVREKVESRLCGKSDRKPCLPKANEISTELLVWLFKEDPDLRLFKERMTVRQKSQFPGLNRSILLVLKLAKRPLSKKNILSELQKTFPKRSFSIKQIQSTTSNSPQCCDQIFLWNRGGVHSETLYVHKDYIKTDLPILKTIEEILIETAKQGTVPQVRLNSLFNKYSEECVAQGIPNVYALFSSLKVRGCNRFSFQRTPYIGFEGHRQKLSNAKILEEFVKKSGRSVSRQEMREFGRSLGLQDEHISNTIVLANLVANQDGYVYRADAPEQTPEFGEMVQRLLARLAKKGSTTASELYDAERGLCDRLEITDAKMLFSLLRRAKVPGIHLRYPQIQRSAHPGSRRRKA
ncbi:MAG: hypothetical protein IK105_06480 [Thermoguttaceae bacterium]|nr:hypothetical protein [Thermoguttaceae bacterium]MBR6480580.1 hypothetical protein [Thermoguttaceae bacterium]